MPEQPAPAGSSGGGGRRRLPGPVALRTFQRTGSSCCRRLSRRPSRIPWSGSGNHSGRPGPCSFVAHCGQRYAARCGTPQRRRKRWRCPATTAIAWLWLSGRCLCAALGKPGGDSPVRSPGGAWPQRWTLQKYGLMVAVEFMRRRSLRRSTSMVPGGWPRLSAESWPGGLGRPCSCLLAATLREPRPRQALLQMAHLRPWRPLRLSV
mmetsp:Transcript_37379/g.81965  ORF Transcript_37379/g.81965 Transcript_37379/m.81965 type:complete len:207 (-) Transcript_37379:254-874(-)